MAEQIAFTTPQARTEHVCSLCSRTIEPGETYARHRMVGDDGPYVWKQCAHCRVLMAECGDEIVWDWSEGYCDDTVRDWEPSTVRGLRLLVQFKRRWRRRDGALYPVPDRSSTPGQDPS